MEKIVTAEYVFLNVAPKKGKKKQTIEFISELISEKSGLNKRKLAKGFLNREKLSTTGFGNGFAIPHTKADVKTGIVAFVRFEAPVEWEAMDGEPVTNAIFLIMPEEDGDNQHLAMISKMARLLMHEEFVKQLNELQTEEEISGFLTMSIQGAGE